MSDPGPSREPAGSDGSTPGAGDDYRSRLFGSYRTSTYIHRTDLTPEGLQNNARQHLRLIGRFLPEDRAAPILEIGAGNGGFLLACRQRGHQRVFGVDISPEQVAFCHDLGFEEIRCANGLDYLRDCDQVFETIVMNDVLEHVPKDRVLEMLSQARAHLRPGGHLILRVPNMSNPLNLRTRYVDFTHEVGFSRESLLQVLRVSGFEVETVFGAFQPHPRWWLRWLFDGLLWRLFQLIHKRVLHLPADVVRGKNLIAVTRRPPPSDTQGAEKGR